MYTNYYSELYHFGIKGQKWGVRRYQNADGSLTPEGYEHYGVTKEKIRKEKQRIVDKYASKTNNKTYKEKLSAELSDDEIANNMVRKKKALKIAAAVGIGLGVTIAGAYMYKTYGSTFLDKTLKSGSTLQTLSMDSDRFKKAKLTGEPFYAALTRRDKDNYKAWFGQEIGILGAPTGNTKFNIQLKAKDKIKIASRKNARKVFDDLCKDPNFKDAAERLHPDSNFHVGDKKGGLDLYKKFNISIVNRSNPERNKLYTKFFDELKKRGYSGLTDENDVSAGFLNKERRGNPWQTSMPAIMIDMDKIVQKTAAKKLTNEEISKAKHMQILRALTSDPAFVAKASALPASSILIASSSKEKKMVKNAKKNIYRNRNKVK